MILSVMLTRTDNTEKEGQIKMICYSYWVRSITMMGSLDLYLK